MDQNEAGKKCAICRSQNEVKLCILIRLHQHLFLHLPNTTSCYISDWAQLFQTKCFGCQFPIEPGDRWVEALSENWHSECFNCSVSSFICTVQVLDYKFTYEVTQTVECSSILELLQGSIRKSFENEEFYKLMLLFISF